MAHYADWCVEHFNARVVLIAMEHMDSKPTRQIYEEMKHQSKVRLALSDEWTVDEIMALLAKMKFQCTTRYHTTVLAAPFNIPMLSVSSDTRCEAVFNELEMQDYFVDYVKHPRARPLVENLDEILIKKTKALVSNELEIKQRLQRANKSFVERSQKNIEIFSSWFEEWYSKKYKE